MVNSKSSVYRNLGGSESVHGKRVSSRHGWSIESITSVALRAIDTQGRKTSTLHSTTRVPYVHIINFKYFHARFPRACQPVDRNAVGRQLSKQLRLDGPGKDFRVDVHFD